MHLIQIEILRKLLFSKKLHYSEIKEEEMEGSLFTFHLKRLMQKGFVEKTADTYKLTERGKEFANQVDDQGIREKKLPKTTTVLCCVKNIDGENEYLLYRRKKNPFFDCQGFPTRKVWFGEKLEDIAKDGLHEETGLIGEPQLFAIRHYLVYSTTGKLLEDKVMYAFRFLNPKGILKGCNQGIYEWVKESGLKKYMDNPQEEFWEIFKLLINFENPLTFKEVVQHTTKF